MTPKTPRTPWLVRVCPEHYQKTLLRVGVWVGGIGYMAYMMGGLLALVFGPLIFAWLCSDAPISRMLIWCRQLFPNRVSFFLVYCSIGFAVAWVLFVGITIFDYVRFNKTPINSVQPTAGRSAPSGG